MSEYDFVTGYFEPGISVLEKKHTAHVEGTKITFDVKVVFDSDYEEYVVYVMNETGDERYIGSFPTDVAHKMLSSINNHIPDIVPEN